MSDGVIPRRDGVIPAEAGIQLREHHLGPRSVTKMRRGDGNRERRCKGLSLIELLTTLAIFALVLGLGVPNYRDWIASRELANHAEYLAETLNLARSEAVKRGIRVNLCKSRDGKQCDDEAPWEVGWIVFSDENRDGQVEDTDSIIRREGPPGGQITITPNRPVENYVSYTSFGYARALDGALQMGTFVVCKPGQKAIDVVLANSGRVRVSRTPRPCP